MHPVPALITFYLRSRALRALALIILVVLAWGIFFGAPTAPRFPPYRLDVDVYRLGGHAAQVGVPLYEHTFRTHSGIDLPFTYPPLAAQLFTVLAWMNLDYAATLMAGGSVIALFVAVWVTLRDLTALRGVGLVWVSIGILVLVIYLMPFRETVNFGQINVFLMLLVLVDLTIGRDRWWRGSLIGLAAAVKLTPLVFGIYFLVRRDLRGALQTLLVAGLLTVIGFLRAPQDSMTYWTHTVFDSGRIGSPGFASNQSIQGLLARTDLPDSAQQVLWLVAVVLLGGVTTVIMWQLIDRGEHFGALSINAFFGLLASPVSWSHHWVWVVPMLIWLVWCAGTWRHEPVARRHASGPDRVLLAFAAAGWWIFFTAPQFRLPHGMGQEQRWSVLQVLYGNLWTWWALALLVLGAIKLSGHGGRPLAASLPAPQ